ncbi:MAG: hypothetical protein ABL308_08890 [Oceanicaulis sp.]
MRQLIVFIATLFALAAPASAEEFRQSLNGSPEGPVAVAVIEIGPELSERAGEYGERELLILQRKLEGALIDALLDAGRYAEVDDPSASTLLVVIEDATPNRPTFQQLADRPSLSARTVSIGGARVTAVMSDPAGDELGRFAYSWRTPALDREQYTLVWTDAENAFDRFARMVAAELTEEPVRAAE